MANDDSSTSPISANTSTNQSTKTLEESLKSIINPQTQLITVTLDENNFLLWKFQIEMAIKGYGLHKFIDPATEVPQQFTNQNDQLTINTEYVIYQRQDSLLCSWLLSSISTDLMSQVIGCKTSLEVWNAIHQNFSSQTTARIMSYKRQLQTIKKDNMKIREYLSKIKNICDLLDSSGHKVNETEQVLSILNGLDDSFEVVVAVISSRETTPTVQYVTSILLAHEGRLEQKNTSSEEFSINYAAASKNKSNYQPETKSNYTRGGHAGRNTQGYGRGSTYSRGRGRGRSNSNRPKCQICERIGHTALRCYFRFDSNHTSNQQNSPNQNSTKSYPYTVNLSHVQNDTGYNSGNQETLARNEDIQDEAWFPDSGATHHVTNNLQNLNLGGTTYKGGAA